MVTGHGASTVCLFSSAAKANRSTSALFYKVVRESTVDLKQK